MQQVTQRVRDGRVEVLDVPAPAVTPDGVLVDVRASLLSAGTERTKIQTGRQSLIGKARSRPDQVQKVLEKAQRDGVRATVQHSACPSRKLPAPMSACSATASPLWEYSSSTKETALASTPAAPALPTAHASDSPPGVGLVGAGSFAQGTIVPALVRAGFALAGVASATGRTAEAAKVQFGFAYAARTEDLLDDPNIDVIAVATPHASHAELTIAGEASKAVFVEKPPCLTADELDRVRTTLAAAARPLLVGFNRRHAPLARQLREGVRRPGIPFELLFRVNAGGLPADHWLNDPEDGGGRLLGEGCHFVDFACWFAGALPVRVSCTLRPEGGQPLAAAQSFSLTLDFADGWLATVCAAPGAPLHLRKSTWRRTPGAARACSMISGR
jgi:predicted dehydrogenase